MATTPASNLGEELKSKKKTQRTAKIYQDPISRMAVEGRAVLVKKHSEPFKTLPESLSRWDVRFSGETETVVRLVHADDIDV